MVSAAALWWALSVTPDYWQPIYRTRPEVRQTAERFEQGLRAFVSGSRATTLSAWPSEIPHYSRL